MFVRHDAGGVKMVVRGWGLEVVISILETCKYPKVVE
jgi:hypothetical protein